MRLFKNIHQKQGGQILVLSLIVLCLSTLIVVPLMGLMNTSLKSTQVYLRNTQEIYAADTGFQTALWKLEHDTTIANDRADSQFDKTYSYTLPNANNNTLSLQIYASWIFNYLKIITGATPHEGDLGVTSSASAGTFTITFTNLGVLPVNISELGIWLPRGCNYVAGSCSKSNFNPNIDYNEPHLYPVFGGYNLKWDDIKGNDGQLLAGVSKTQKFKYSPTTINPVGASAWVLPQQAIGAGWDNSISWYDVTSTAVDQLNGKITTIRSTVVHDSSITTGSKLVTISYVIN